MAYVHGLSYLKFNDGFETFIIEESIGSDCTPVMPCRIPFFCFFNYRQLDGSLFRLIAKHFSRPSVSAVVP